MARIIHPHIYASIRSIALKVSLRRLEAYQHSIYHEGLVSSLIFSLKHSIETSIALKAILVDSEGPNPRFQRRPGSPLRPKARILAHNSLEGPPRSCISPAPALHEVRRRSRAPWASSPEEPVLFSIRLGKPMSGLMKSGFSSLACNTSPWRSVHFLHQIQTTVRTRLRFEIFEPNL